MCRCPQHAVYSPILCVVGSDDVFFNKVRKEYCPDYLYLYLRHQIYPVKPKE